MEERLIKRLMTSIKCSSCGQHYEVYNIDILGHSEDMWFLKARCSTCDTQCLVAATIKESRVSEVVTDLSEAELDTLADSDAVAVDDVLNMHNFLKDFDGNFSRLFGQRQP